MAPLPTIPNVVRLDFDWPSVSGVKPHNTLHVLTNSTDLEQIALDVGTAYSATADSPWTPMYSGYTISTIDVTPLDGSTARQTHPLGTSMGGAGTGGLLPAVAALVHFSTNRRGPRGRGRQYIGPVGEAGVSDGLMLSPTLVTDAWNEFNDNLAETDSLMSLCVASYTHSDVHGVTGIVCKTPVATQRRRQRQLQ